MKKVHYFLVVGFMMVFISINAQEKQEEKDESVNTLFGGKGEKVTYGGFRGPKFGLALLNGRLEPIFGQFRLKCSRNLYWR